MIPLKSTIEETIKKAISSIQRAQTVEDLENIRLEFFSRKGIFANLMDQLSTLPLEQKRTFGPLLNQGKQEALALFEQKKNNLEKQVAHSAQERAKNFDVSLTVPLLQGSLHPLTRMSQEICEIFISMGYDIIDGPEVETEFFNFEALNIPADHPARDMWDTLFLDDTQKHVLRTHTSPVQIHAMQQHRPPFAFVAPGRCYRHEATDATHDIQFMQLEGVFVAENVSLGNLMATLETFLQTFFKKKLSTRVRPSYFPFVEPGIEMDIECPFCNNGCSVCKYSTWIESCGAGLIHPRVLAACNIDTQRYTGFAFGMGLTRLAMLKYNINDIRLLHSNNIEFLQQF